MENGARGALVHNKQLGFDSWDAMSREGFLEFWGAGMYGAKWYDAQKLKLNLNSSEMVATVENFTAFRTKTGWDKVVEFRRTYGEWSGRRSGITLGAQAMQINGYWTPGEIRIFAEASADMPSKLAYTWIPT